MGLPTSQVNVDKEAIQNNLRGTQKVFHLTGDKQEKDAKVLVLASKHLGMFPTSGKVFTNFVNGRVVFFVLVIHHYLSTKTSLEGSN